MFNWLQNLTLINFKLTGTFLHEVFFSNYTRFCNTNIVRLVYEDIINKFLWNQISKWPVPNVQCYYFLPTAILKKMWGLMTKLMFKLEVNSHSKIKSNIDFSIGTTLKKTLYGPNITISKVTWRIRDGIYYSHFFNANICWR